MKYMNYTPHTVNLNDGRAFESLGVARVGVSFSQPSADGVVSQVFGEVIGLPAPQDGVKLIVSLLVLQASDRGDLVAPASGHPDTIRNDKGHIVSVPYFVR